MALSNQFHCIGKSYHQSLNEELIHYNISDINIVAKCKPFSLQNEDSIILSVYVSHIFKV